MENIESKYLTSKEMKDFFDGFKKEIHRQASPEYKEECRILEQEAGDRVKKINEELSRKARELNGISEVDQLKAELEIMTKIAERGGE